MTLAEFDFALPPERIAQAPARPRDSARLLHVAAGLDDRLVADLPALLQPGDLLVANDTQVIPAQLEARRGEARIGLTLDQPLADGSWHALARNARRLHPGDRLRFERDPALEAEILDRDGDSVRVRFNGPFEAAGALALPPYIARPDGPTAADAADYQTVFAAHAGAVAAPTAGLHFTPRLLAALDAAGIGRRAGHAARRRRDVPAGADRRFGPAPDARGARRDQPGGRRRDQPRPPGRGGGHDVAAPDRERRGRGRDRAAVRAATRGCSSPPATASAGLARC